MASETSPRTKAFIALHSAVFLWGFTAILGKLISYGSIYLVWHRMAITALVYFAMPIVWKQIRILSAKTIAQFLGIGIIVCAHWLTFYGSIKLGNSVSITLACLGSASFFASIIEPFLLKKPFSQRDIFMGLIVMLGVIFIYFSLPQPSNPNQHYGWAVVAGLLSAALAATFTTLNKKYITTAGPLAISALEMLSGALFLTIIVPFASPDHIQWLPHININHLSVSNLRDGSWDLIWIAILAVLCTNLTFYLGTYALQQLSAFTANLTVNLEPIYGIVLGALIFHENQDLNVWFYTGTGIILSAIFAQAYLSNRKQTPIHPGQAQG
jgi:drug/metabolite transporter (DMT)-like permease